MKKSLISVGKTYANDSDGIRKVIELVNDQWGNVVVSYVMIAGHRKDAPSSTLDGLPVHGCYLQSFATWAKKEVD
ncbi:hypothetical protein RYA05_00995 [Pseudomonas syringae pv. actinidiae]|nr:hypothetical protein [Pseudomonas syringae pv. actinidiae]